MDMRFVAVAVCGLALASAPATSSGADDECSVRKVDYLGWKCVELTNGRVDVVVAPELGGRIIQLRLGDAEYLWVNPKLAGKVVSYVTGKVNKFAARRKETPEWANYGGDKLWPAPQGVDTREQWPGPPDPVHLGGTVDNGAYELKILESKPSLAAIRLTGPDDLYAGVRFTREIRLRPATTTIELKAGMANISKRTVRWGIWQVTQHAGHIGKKGEKPNWDRNRIDVQGWSPINPLSQFSKGYYVMFGPEDNPQFKIDLSSESLQGPKLFRLDYQYTVGKIGMDNQAGWLAVTHQRSKHFYAHTFPPAANQPHPDSATVEFWASGPGAIKLGDEKVKMSAAEPVLIESEVLSPFARLSPGQRFSYETRVHLARGVGPVAHVSQAGAEIETVRRGATGGLRGKISVFHDGELRVIGDRKGSVTLTKVRAGQCVDLAKVEVAAKLSGKGEVQLIDPHRRPLGEWRIR